MPIKLLQAAKDLASPHRVVIVVGMLTRQLAKLSGGTRTNLSQVTPLLFDLWDAVNATVCEDHAAHAVSAISALRALLFLSQPLVPAAWLGPALSTSTGTWRA
jgi:hypothetical protein